MPELDDEAILRQLEEDGLLRREGEVRRTTRKWQSAMARAAFWLLQSGDSEDLRLPITVALAEIYGASRPDEEIARLVDVLVPIEARELDPREYIERLVERAG